MTQAAVRRFDAQPVAEGAVPCLIGIVGPPGVGKTFSSLRLAKGVQAVNDGPIVLIDTESGRPKKYHVERGGDFDFLHVPFEAPFRPEDFLTAVQQQVQKHNPSAVIIDSLSDEHEGTGGVLDWHDQEVPRMSGNEWAAWSKPKASRRKMMSGFLQITTPLIFTFRAREKTKSEKQNGKNVPVNIGYQPIAPAEIIYGLDVTCILPPRANGVPIWKSDKIGEDFIIKLPKFLQHCFKEREELNERTGEALARWAKGDTAHTAKSDGGIRPSEVAAPEQSDEDKIAAEVDALTNLRAAATNGMTELEAAWTALPNAIRKKLKGELDALKATATEFDLRAAQGEVDRLSIERMSHR